MYCVDGVLGYLIYLQWTCTTMMLSHDILITIMTLSVMKSNVNVNILKPIEN